MARKRDNGFYWIIIFGDELVAYWVENVDLMEDGWYIPGVESVYKENEHDVIVDEEKLTRD